MLSRHKCLHRLFQKYRHAYPGTTYLKYSSDVNDGKNSETSDFKLTGLAKALGKFRELEKGDKVEKTEVQEEKHSFLNLLRNSQFVRLGNPRGQVLIGKIFKVVNSDLYIDFGGKFYCVCRKPKMNPDLYVRNAVVKIRLNELELCARFLGAEEDLTLTEASATLLDLVDSPFNKENSQFST